MTSHTSLPCSLTGMALGKVTSKEPPSCVPNIVLVLAEMKQLGEGILDDVVLPTGGCTHLS